MMQIFKQLNADFISYPSALLGMSLHAWPTEGDTPGGAGDNATQSASNPISPTVHTSYLQPGEMHQS